MHTLGLKAGGRIDYRSLLGLQWRQLIEDGPQGRLVEPGAYLARVAQLAAVGIVQPQQQRAEFASCAFGIGVAHHHELLTTLALEFDPVTAAA